MIILIIAILILLLLKFPLQVVRVYPQNIISGRNCKLFSRYRFYKTSDPLILSDFIQKKKLDPSAAYYCIIH